MTLAAVVIKITNCARPPPAPIDDIGPKLPPPDSDEDEENMKKFQCDGTVTLRFSKSSGSDSKTTSRRLWSKWGKTEEVVGR